MTTPQDPPAPSGRQVELAYGNQQATVVEVGGGLRCYRVGGHDVLDGYDHTEMCTSSRGQILAPWPNRLEDGRYRFADADQVLALSEPAKGNAIHGLVRFVNWTGTKVDAARARQTYRLHPQPGYPFLVDLAVEYRLDEEGLTVDTTLTNAGPRPCPVGLGFHPYLRAGTETIDPLVLTCPAEVAYRTDERGLPVGTDEVAGGALDFRAGRPLDGQVLDTAFGQLARDASGRATVTLSNPAGGQRVRLWLGPSYSHVMVFTGDTLASDRRRRGLAVEPMTCAANAFRTGDGLTVLAPGQSLVATWGITTEGF